MDLPPDTDVVEQMLNGKLQNANGADLTFPVIREIILRKHMQAYQTPC